MEGEEERSEVEGSISKASIPKRIAVEGSRWISNIIFALLIYFALMSCVGNNVSNVIEYSSSKLQCTNSWTSRKWIKFKNRWKENKK